jgi:4-aminobutyrate aminotransferase
MTSAQPTTSPTASEAVLDRIRAHEGGGLRTFMSGANPLVWERAHGSHVEDADGRRYLDFDSGFAVSNVGWTHPDVTAAIQRQAAELTHCPSAYASRTRAEFYEALAAIAPAGLTRIIPAITGAMANEIAVSYARLTRGDGPVVTFDGSYFGRSLAMVAYAGKPAYREALGVEPAATFFPYPQQLAMGDDATDQVMGALERWTAEQPVAPALVMLEPIQGNTGMIVPPDDFLPRLREYCDRTGAALLVDEVQSGCGRTGRMWAIEHSDTLPDLMTVGKGIGGGMAVGAVLGREELRDWKPDSVTSTFLTNALPLAAATAAMTVVREQRLDRRSAELGATLLDGLRSGVGALDGVADVRGRGLWCGVQLDDPEAAGRAQAAARAAGLLVGRGSRGDVLVVRPPLTIEPDDLAEGVATLTDAVRGSLA